MIAVNYFIPYYVNDAQSDIRGIKGGWYTMDERGKLLRIVADAPRLTP